MKVFVTGVGGQLGHDVMNELAKVYEADKIYVLRGGVREGYIAMKGIE